MYTAYEIEKILNKVQNEKKKLVKKLAELIDSSTIFRRFTKERIECSAKIDILNEMENLLATELRRAKLIEETN